MSPGIVPVGVICLARLFFVGSPSVADISLSNGMQIGSCNTGCCLTHTHM